MTRPPSRLSVLWISALAVLAPAQIAPAMAYSCQNGQIPAPPEVAARMALPLCGFAATKRWGPNGCQLCDPRNMHPNPYGADDPHRAQRYRAYQ